MDSELTILALGALAQPTRLAVFRLLVQAGPEGIAAGAIAAAVAAQPSTLSHHLGELERAGLAVSRRDGRQVIYAADYQGTRRLLEFLMRNQGQIVTRSMLLEAVWDARFDAPTNVVNVHISRLRGKIDRDFTPELIHTVRGDGYRFGPDV